MSKISGWLTPKGEVVKCGTYGHIDVAKKNPYFLEKVPKIYQILDRIEESRQFCEDLQKSDGHGEWHSYEITYDRADGEIRNLLLDAGFIRIGSDNKSIYFEGRPIYLKDRHQKCKKLAESYDLEAVFEPQKN